MAWEVEGTDEFADWYGALTAAQQIGALGGRLEIAAVFPDQRITFAPDPCAGDETAREHP